ncbi:MAG: hypothetical protein GY868_00145, partial [Deltaproteobacteria bacterium]|nr:hypothetical protein [Deltaproteobacteria bacterium]
VQSGLQVTAFNYGAQLACATRYNWKVVARDSGGKATAGPVWSFTTEAAPAVNQPPAVPSNPVPFNGSRAVAAQQVTLAWSGSDPDGDAVTYELSFGSAKVPPVIAEALTANGFVYPEVLETGVTYYWQVTARDSSGKETAGPVWTFSTKEELAENTPPFVPADPAPVNAAADVPLEALLAWQGGDPDNDEVRYDVYLGMWEPVLYQNGLTLTGLAVPDLNPESGYVWYVTAVDSAGASTQGPVWSFLTGAAAQPPAPQRICPARRMLRDDPAALAALQDYRDRVLVKHAGGRRLINLYYQYGPAMTVFLQESPSLKKTGTLVLKALAAGLNAMK